MAAKIFTLCFIATLIVFSSSSLYGAVASGDHELGWIPAARSGYLETVGDFLYGDEEFELDSEASRRILATTSYISYGALQRNTVPCSRRGASYYNCRSGAQANPYSRGCSAITRCRS